MDVESPAPPAEDEEQLLNFDFRRYLGALRKYAWAVIAIVGARRHRRGHLHESSAEDLQRHRLGPDRAPADAICSASATTWAAAPRSAGRTTTRSSSRSSAATADQAHRRAASPVQPDAERGRAQGSQGRGSRSSIATARLRGSLRVAYPEDNRIMYVVRVRQRSEARRRHRERPRPDLHRLLQGPAVHGHQAGLWRAVDGVR